MGWKNLKEHFRIRHIVCVTKAGICIGSPYVHDLLVVKADGTFQKPHQDIGENDDLRRYRTEFAADPAKVRDLLNRPDTFAASITVFTYEMGEIIEKQCEALGWPNVTHDGLLMYDNEFSDDRDQVVVWAEQNAACGAKSLRETIVYIDGEQRQRRERLAEYEGAIAKLGVRRGAADWLQTTLYKGVEVLDPDGWDRSDLERSWEEPITRAEFERRLMQSSCKFPSWFGLSLVAADINGGASG